MQNSKDRSIIIIGNPGGWRINYFQKALSDLSLNPAKIVTYLDLIQGRVILSDLVKKNSIVRIESPDMDFQVEKLLLEKGVNEIEEKFDKISLKQIQELKFDKGRIYPQRQWYLGFCEVLKMIENQLSDCPTHFIFNSPSDIKLMFDKNECHEYLSKKGIKIPRSINPVGSYDELIEKMVSLNIHQVFIKLSNGSGASGVVAYRYSKDRQVAITTTEMVRNSGNDIKFYNSKKIQVYRKTSDIRVLINYLCQNNVHVEEWIPKAGIDDHTFDLRVVVINGSVGHVVVRLGKSPITNLHLTNKRGDFKDVLAKMGDQAWQSAKKTCEKTIKLFPNSFYAGIDLLISSNFSNHVVLELNAFGDLLLDPINDRVDPYMMEIQALNTWVC